MKSSVSDADQKLVLVYDLWARLYWPVAFLEALRTSEGGSHLKQGSRSAIFMVIIEDRVPSNARLSMEKNTLIFLLRDTIENQQNPIPPHHIT